MDVVSLLSAQARGPLRAWLQANAERVRAVVARAPAPRRAVAAQAGHEARGDVPAMAYGDAVAWAKRAAADLLDATVIIDGNMVEDEIGASISTVSGLRNFVGAPDDLQINLRGIELLRTHVNQIGPDEFKAAQTAIRREAARQGANPLEGNLRIFPVYKTAKSGLSDGSAYAWDKDKRNAFIRFPLKRGGVRVNDLLAAARIPRSAYQWAKQSASDAYASWLVVQPDWVARIADAVAEHYPVLAAALRQNAPIWVREAGVQVPTGGAPAQDLDPKKGQIDAGKYDSMQWRQADDGLVALRVPLLGRLLKSTDVTYRWLRDARGKVDERFILIIAPDELAKALVVIGKELPAGTAQTLAALLPAWLASAQVSAQAPGPGPTASAPPAPTAAAGRTPEGSWTTENNLVYLSTRYKADAVGWHRPLGSAVVWDKVRKAMVFAPRHALAVAGALEAHFPVLAEALSQAFAATPQTAISASTEMGVPHGVRAQHQDALLHLRDIADLDAVRGADAQRAVAEVARAVSLRSPPAMQHKPYQTIGTAFAMLTGYRALIADEPGVGKTAQAIGCLLTAPETLLPCVIVCPGSVVYNWRKELKMWAPSVPTYIVKNGAVKIPHGMQGAVILSWDMLASNTSTLKDTGRVDNAGKPVRERIITGWPILDQLKGWAQCAIFDESHYMKNLGVNRTDAALMLARLTPHALLLSGTPIENKPWEAWTQLHAVDPQAWPSYKDFVAQYAVTDQWGSFVASKNTKELRELIAPFTIRRRKAQVLRDLPPLTRVYVSVDMPKPVWTEYERVSNQFKSWLGDEYRIRLEKAQAKEGIDPRDKAAQAAISARIQAAIASEALTKSSQLRAVLAQGKIPTVVAKVQELLDQEQPVVVFLDHISGALDALHEALAKKKIKHGIIQGGMTDKAKFDAVDNFQSGKYDVILLSQAGREGITLTRASNMIMTEYFWTPGRMEQAEGRLHRQGQKNPVTIWYMHVDGTYDDDMRGILESKAAMVSSIMGSDEVAVEEIADADFYKALTERRTSGTRTNGRTRAVLVHAGTPAAQGPAIRIPATRSIRALVFYATHFPNRAVAQHWLRGAGLPSELSLHPDGYVATLADARRFAQGSLRVSTVAPGVRAVVGAPLTKKRPPRRVGAA